MALKLVINKSFCYVVNLKTDKLTKKTWNISLDTESLTSTFGLVNKDQGFLNYKFSLVDLSFHKKMYQPTEVVASIEIVAANNTTWSPLAKDVVDEMFKKKQVSLYDNAGVKNENGVDVIPEGNKVGLDFYVQDVQTCYKSSSMTVILKIYSLDKLLTLENKCRTFVSQKLGPEIMKTELSQHKKPFDQSTTIDYSTDNMKVLLYDYVKETNSNPNKLGAYLSKKGREHIFPYLVQYKESFYDMLARTCNRWGEFLFYEDGKLQVGYTNPTRITSINNYTNLTYIDLDSLKLGKSANGASYDKNLLETVLSKSPNEVSGEMFFLRNGGWDKYFMKKLAQVWKNDKSLPTFLTNVFIDDAMSTFQAMNRVRLENEAFDEKYFGQTRTSNTQYSEDHYRFKDDNEEYCQFTEHHSIYNEEKYGNILSKEQAAATDAVCMDFDTTFPGLKLGQLIGVNGGFYIVVEINCKKKIMTTYELEDGNIKEVQKSSLVFEVIATPQNTVKDSETEETPSDLNFYPTILPSGHIRYAEPQIAVVTDSDDPKNQNRVRVKFAWENAKVGEDGTFADTDIKSSSPWLTYATSSAGKGVIGKHYTNTNVLVGFAEGNVERPYVMGGLSLEANEETSGNDIVYQTPGGQTLKLDDGNGKGLLAFLAGCLSPISNTVMGFLPDSSFDKMPVKGLEGGFTLTDKYGIYKISGSTDEREVNISSAWGDVKINAFTGISISSPNGDISIKGKNVKIEAGNNLELVSGTNVRYKIFGDNTPIISDMLSAAAKKVIEKFTPIDLSMVRSVFEIFIRPTEGKLRIKSNRYLMLESGKGACDYPEDAYSSQDVKDKLIQKELKSNVRPGVNLLPGMRALFGKIQDVGNKINDDYITKYNECVDEYANFETEVTNSLDWANRPNNPGQPIKICNIITDQAFKDKLWDPKTKKLKEDDLGFADCYKVSGEGDVSDTAISHYTTNHLGNHKTTNPEIKKDIIELRKSRRKAILDVANSLKTKINAFLAAPDLSEKTIMGLLNIPAVEIDSSFKKSMVKCFSRKELDDVVYFQDIDDTRKAMASASKYPDTDSLSNDRKAMMRKVALLFLNEMGFKDEWRAKVPDPNWVAPNVGGTAIVPAPPHPLVSVPRKTAAADLADDAYWNSYVDTIVSAPIPSKDQFAITKTLKDEWNGFVDKLYFFKSYNENKSWGNAKNGSILFSSDGNIYSLKGEISQVNALIKPNLTTTDAVVGNDVSSFLDDDSANGTASDGMKKIIKGLH